MIMIMTGYLIPLILLFLSVLITTNFFQSEIGMWTNGINAGYWLNFSKRREKRGSRSMILLELWQYDDDFVYGQQYMLYNSNTKIIKSGTVQKTQTLAYSIHLASKTFYSNLSSSILRTIFMKSQKLSSPSLNFVSSKFMQSSRAFRLLVSSRICQDLSPFGVTKELKSCILDVSLCRKNSRIFMFQFLRYYYYEATLYLIVSRVWIFYTDFKCQVLSFSMMIFEDPTNF